MNFPNLKSYFIFHRETLSLGESHRKILTCSVWATC